MNSFDDIQSTIRKFVHERDWKQYHTPKNLCISLMIELAELSEHFQWKTDQDVLQMLTDPKKKEEIGEEIADVFSYLLSLCDSLDVDLLAVTKNKMEKNAAKYPVEKVKGKAHKYTYYQSDSENG